MTEIAERMQDAMREKGLSYGELADLSNIPKSAVFRYVTGETEKIPLDRIERIAAALGVSAAFLMGWEPEEAMKKMTVSASEEKLLNGLRQLTPAQQETLLALLEGAVQNLKGKDSHE